MVRENCQYGRKLAEKLAKLLSWLDATRHPKPHPGAVSGQLELKNLVVVVAPNVERFSLFRENCQFWFWGAGSKNRPDSLKKTFLILRITSVFRI
jgi:hypothetical protein